MESQPTRSDNESSQKKRVRYGSQPPVGLMSGAEVSRWLLEAVKEEKRLAKIELAENRRIAAEKFGSKPSTDKQPAPSVHRGCKYRLPSSVPIAIPKIPYNPFDYLWFHQQLRLHEVYMTMNAPKKLTKAIRNLVDIVFQLGFLYDLEYDLYDSDFGEKEDKQCPICSCSPEEVNQEIKIEVVQETIHNNIIYEPDKNLSYEPGTVHLY
ncbi:hypothetical protein FRX31_027119 [Thalictrum thalictroides]|uniref:Uncharacterized protein n=1 Tax=Thalictrum thalictroides TaxID=46969 RepID=A0A7J6VEH1_THATH|nr:hypothetical protein FRX31_027119 [Thalictrum thalictroides]